MRKILVVLTALALAACSGKSTKTEEERRLEEDRTGSRQVLCQIRNDERRFHPGSGSRLGASRRRSILRAPEGQVL